VVHDEWKRAGVVQKPEISASLPSYLKEPRSHVKQKQPGSQNARILFPHLSYNPDAN